MKLRGIAILAVVALLGAVCADLARADTVVVAGKRMSLPGRFEPVGDDIYAPLLAVLGPITTRRSVTTDYVQLTTRAGREIHIYFRRPEATVDGALRPLPVMPKIEGRNILLPAKAVASLLGCSARWDQATRTLIIHPWIRRFTVETLQDRIRVTIASEQPLRYEISQAAGPTRLLIDISNADLASIPSDLQVNSSYFDSARIAQRTLFPQDDGDSVRAVLSLSESHPYREELSRDGCQLQVDLPLPVAAAAPSPEAPRPAREREAPSEAPAVLSDVTFHRYSPQLAALTLYTSGKVRCTSGDSSDPPTIWVDVSNAECRVPAQRCLVHDTLVSDLTLKPAPDQPGTQRLTLALSHATPYAVIPGNNQVQVVLGRRELSDLTVVIDAGHGGSRSGAVGHHGLIERDVTLDVARRVQKLLSQTGARVILTRTDSGSVQHMDVSSTAALRQELRTRCAIANEAGADLFVSIHCNAAGTNQLKRRGTETYYRKLDSVAFARVMQQEVVNLLGLPDGGARYHPEPIIVLYQTSMPAVLVELAYISNPQDEALLRNPDFRERAAQGIVNGIRRYSEEADLLSSFGRRRADSDSAHETRRVNDLVTRGDDGTYPPLRDRDVPAGAAPNAGAGGDAGSAGAGAASGSDTGGGSGDAGGAAAGSTGAGGNAVDSQ